MLHDFAIETALAQSKPVAWCAPQYRMIQDDWKELTNILAPVIVRRNEQRKQIEVVGGGTIDFWSLDNADSIRGRRYRRMIVNEAGLVSELIDYWNMIMRPTLVDFTGDAYFAGTPKGRNGFNQLYNQQGVEWAHWQVSSYSNPHIPRSELDALKGSLPDRVFRQEILAEFVDDGGGVFRGVRAAATVGEAREPIAGGQYVIGVDWGRTNDATVFCVVDVQARAMVCIDRMTDTNYNLQRDRLGALAARYNNAPILAESNAMGLPNIEALQEHGINITPFVTTNATKMQIIDALSLAFERNEIGILADETLILELESYESKRTGSGLISYSAPSGGHDDTVIALALAWHAAAYSGVALGIA